MTTAWSTEALGAYNDLKADGFAVTVREIGSEGVWDPEEMEYTGTGDDVDYVSYGIKKSYSVRDIDGTTIQQGDTLLILSAYGVNAAGTLTTLPALDTTYKILIGGVEQNVISIGVEDPGNVVILYKVQIRG